MWPFKPRQPAVETKSLAEPDAELLALFGAYVNGVAAVPASVALTVPAVAAAVRVIGEASATLPVTVKRKVGDQEADVPDFPALKLLTGTANPWTSGFELIRDIVSQALTQDRGGLAWVNRVNGQPAEIIRYDNGTIDVQFASDGSGMPIYRLAGKVIPSADVIHVRGTLAKCPLTQCAEAIGVAHILESYAARLWTQGSKPGGVISFPGKLGDAGLKAVKAGWQAAHSGADNAGKTAVLWEGATWSQMTMNSTDAQFLENRKFQLDEVARAFRVPPSMIYSLDRMTWSNWESAGREFITYTLMPWLKALEAALNRALLTDEERGEYRFCFDVDDTTQADLTARATAISTLISAKVLNSNEARDWLGMPPRAGGDIFENPNTGSSQPGATPAANNNQPMGAAA